MKRGHAVESLFPWGAESGVRSTLLTAACGVGLVLTWLGVSNRAVFENQIPWLSAGIVILMVSMYAHASLIIRARRVMGVRRARMIGDALLDLYVLNHGAEVMNGSPRGSVDNIDEIERVVIVEGRSMFHSTGCPMTSGRSITSIARRTAEGQGSEACEICLRPDASPERSSRSAPVRGDKR
jgi:hypothetical protein